ncbi:MAG: 30S ribosomal protein S6 [Acholeplasmataceae bacterium]
MRKYELMYIIRPSVEPEAIKDIIANLNNVITNHGGNILELKEIGLKDLAYEIEKHKKGYYVWLLVEMTIDAINEYKRIISINENIIRNIEVKLGE